MKGKVRLNKKGKALAVLLAGTVLVGSAIGAIHHFNEEPEEVRVENEVGHDDLIPLPYLSVDSSDFVVLDAGNHQYDGVLFQDAKLKYCDENDISCGVIIRPDTDSLSSVYDDVEYVKSLISKYNISFPVYLNVDTIMDDTSLDSTTMTKYAEAFLKKCSDNGIYVGVYGTDSNLCRFKEYTGISSYDAYVIQDGEEVKYDGTYNVIKDLDGNIKASTDLATVINQNGNNTIDGFQYDKLHTMADGEDILDVAFQYGLSVDDILEFNGISKDEISAGSKIRIPSSLCDDIPEGFVSVDSPLRGADLSYAQGNNVDWDKMVQNFEFLIFKCSEGTEIDPYFEQNMSQANVYEIPAGVYCYNAYDMTNTTSMDDFLAKQKEQADTVIEALKNKNVSYPVYLDVELPSGATWEERFNSEYVSAMLNLWVERMSQAGYIPGLYCNQSGLKNLQSMVNYPLEDHFELWVAGGEQYTAGKQDIPLEEVRPSSILEENKAISMAQATDSAVNSGAGNGKGHLDINFSVKDYSDPLFDDYDGLLAVKEFNHLPFREVGIGALGVGAVVGTGIIAGKMKKGKGKSKAKRR